MSNVVSCPNCGSTNIIFQREQSGSVGAQTNKVYVVPAKKSHGCLYWTLIGWWWKPVYWVLIGWWWNLFFHRRNRGGLGFWADKSINHTMAVCQNCGYSWTAKGSGSQSKIIKGVLIFVGILVFIGIIGTIFGGKDGNKITTSGDASAGTEKPAIEDFTYDISGDKILLKSYTGSKELLEVAASYEIDGKIYQTDISDFQAGIGNHNVKTLILDEGITEIKTSIFNSSNVKKVFFPKSLTLVYDYTLSYLHPSKGEKVSIYYAGTQEEWANIFTSYKRTAVEDAEAAEELGTAMADKLNEMIGTEYDSSKFEYYFSATVDDVK